RAGTPHAAARLRRRAAAARRPVLLPARLPRRLPHLRGHAGFAAVLAAGGAGVVFREHPRDLGAGAGRGLGARGGRRARQGRRLLLPALARRRRCRPATGAAGESPDELRRPPQGADVAEEGGAGGGSPRRRWVQTRRPERRRRRYVRARGPETVASVTTVGIFLRSLLACPMPGFDGVEILGANGYFVDGGGMDMESWCRFALDVVNAVVREIGGQRVGVRLDQFSAEPDEHALALHVVSRLNDHGVLYCHMIEPRVDGRRRVSRQLLPFREAFGGTFIASGGYGREEGDAAVGEGYADLVVYGRLFLANPDLPRRFELGAPLNDCVSATLYGAGA
uniref:NADH:flavin oxidoreductase/NADH oxidase N-terminal domain-containing protein n=1 Tax=Aegilops tauschii subsp. strangulata TaxID=200361 RepID=A0A453T950_AEGTS